MTWDDRLVLERHDVLIEQGPVDEGRPWSWMECGRCGGTDVQVGGARCLCNACGARWEP